MRAFWDPGSWNVRLEPSQLNTGLQLRFGRPRLGSRRAPALPGPQFVQLPISIPEPVLPDAEDPRRAIGSLTIDKLLLEEEDSDTYALNHTLSVEGF